MQITFEKTHDDHEILVEIMTSLEESQNALQLDLASHGAMPDSHAILLARYRVRRIAYVKELIGRAWIKVTKPEMAEQMDDGSMPSLPDFTPEDYRLYPYEMKDSRVVEQFFQKQTACCTCGTDSNCGHFKDTIPQYDDVMAPLMEQE